MDDHEKAPLNYRNRSKVKTNATIRGIHMLSLSLYYSTFSVSLIIFVSFVDFQRI